MKNLASFRILWSMALAVLLPLAVSCASEDENLPVNPETASKRGALDTLKVYAFVEEMPEFKGGEKAMLQFLGRNIKYPEAAKEAQAEGIVVVSFVVQADGRLTDIEVLKDMGHGTAAEAVRVLKMMDGQWKPGRQNGVPVAVNYTLPVRYSLTSLQETLDTDAVEEPATFKEGKAALKKFLSRSIRYPVAAQAQGMATVRYEIKEDGSLQNIAFEEGLDEAINKELVRVLQETKGHWQPAQKAGKAVSSVNTLRVSFVIDTEKGPKFRPLPESDLVVTTYR